jgi:DNA polymerase-3 subunit epsilon
MLREIVLDTETTGLDPTKGDRLIEIGCIELYNRIPTGREYHQFINPDRDVPPEAEAVHGISTQFLRDKPRFQDIADAFLEFIAGDMLVIHNAQFDVSFLSAELVRLGKAPIAMSRVIDTLALARRKHPAGPNSLDALCKRYGVDNSKRTKHGALMDSLLLADVYVELLGERQATLGLAQSAGGKNGAARNAGPSQRKAAQRPVALPPRINEETEAAHRAFIETLGPNAIWLRYGPQAPVETDKAS